MRVELSRITSVKSKVRNTVIDEILLQAENDPIFISDLLVEHETAYSILEALRDDPRKLKQYRLYMIRGEWNEPPSPGFVVKRKFKLPLKDREGTPISATVLNNWKKQGVYDRKRYRYEEYKLDEKGCIIVDIENAEYFLTQFGVHSESNYPISYHPQQQSTEPVNCPYGGKRHVQYWRWKEMTPDMYDKLPVLKTKTEEPSKQAKSK